MLARSFLVFVCDALLVVRTSASSEQLLFLNGCSISLDIYWQGNDGKGVRMGSVPAGTAPEKPGSWSLQTYRGHAFWFQHGSQQASEVVVHQGGVWNVAGVQCSNGGGLETEAVSLTELRRLVAAPTFGTYKLDDVRLSHLGLPIPRSVLLDLEKQFQIDDAPPKVLGERGTCDGARYLKTESEDDELVILSNLPYSLQTHWLHSGGVGQSSFRGATRVNSSVVGELVVAAPGQVCGIRLRPLQQHRFALQSTLSAGLRSEIFDYPGELYLVIVTENRDGKSLLTQKFDEDAIKIFLSSVATLCGKLSDNEVLFKDCLTKNAKLPDTEIILPPSLSYAWFMRLWGTLAHWRLCAYDDSSQPIETIKVPVQHQTLQAELLRKEPLVIAVHNFSTPEECEALQAIVGRNEDLGRAFTSTGTHSKARRTNSKNLYVNWANTGDAFTTLAGRFYEAARYMTGYSLFPEGQEPVNWLYYKAGFEYRPHCDGSCATPSIPYGARVATSLLYCKVADEGGQTVFPEDGLKFTPTPGSLLLFAYNPDPTGVTLHSACPVLRGQKTTATQWYREGVSEEVDWEAVNNGVTPTRREL